MRKLEQVTGPLNFDQELKHLVDYIKLKWEPLADIEKIFKLAADAALVDARAWFDRYAVGETIMDILDAREEALTAGTGVSSAQYYDGPCHCLSQTRMALDQAHAVALQLEHSPWDYSRQVSRLASRIKAEYPQLENARPLGWEVLAKGYEDFDGQVEYCKTQVRQDQDLFQGLDAQGTLSPNFVYRTALPYVMYDEVCQCRAAPEVLVGAVYGYMLGLREHQNTREIVGALQHLAVYLPTPSAPAIGVMPSSGYPLLAALLKIERRPAPTREEYAEALAQTAAFNALSQEERAEKRKANAASMDAILKELLSEKPDPEKEKAEQEAEKAQRTQIQALFRAALK